MTRSDQASTNTDPEPQQGTAPDAHRSLRVGLYVMPALIVLVFVTSWLLLFWLLHEDHDPQSLIQGMQQPGRKSWQKAYALSQLLLDPAYDHLKDDDTLCQALIATLERQNQQAKQTRIAGEPADKELTQFRAFLCRSLGEFRLVTPLPVLLQTAAGPASNAAFTSGDQSVQQAAIEAIAVLATNVGTEKFQANDQLLEILSTACQPGQNTNLASADTNIASAAAFTLGVIGGQLPNAQLQQLLSDRRPDVRYNAAAGLARQGQVEAIPVVLEMLTDRNTARVPEQTPSRSDRKRQLILGNGIQSAERLLKVASPEQRRQLVLALERLSESNDVPPRIQIDAKRLLLELAEEPAGQ